MHLDDFGTARALMTDSLTLLCDIGDKDGIADGLERFAMLATLQAQAARAARLFGAAAELRKAIGTAPAPPDKAAYDALLATIRSSLSTTEFESAWRAGEALTIDEAVREAIDNVQ
jgi:hypothetical protein